MCVCVFCGSLRQRRVCAAARFLLSAYRPPVALPSSISCSPPLASPPHQMPPQASTELLHRVFSTATPLVQRLQAILECNLMSAATHALSTASAHAQSQSRAHAGSHAGSRRGSAAVLERRGSRARVSASVVLDEQHVLMLGAVVEGWLAVLRVCCFVCCGCVCVCVWVCVWVCV